MRRFFILKGAGGLLSFILIRLVKSILILLFLGELYRVDYLFFIWFIIVSLVFFIIFLIKRGLFLLFYGLEVVLINLFIYFQTKGVNWVGVSLSLIDVPCIIYMFFSHLSMRTFFSRKWLKGLVFSVLSLMVFREGVQGDILFKQILSKSMVIKQERKNKNENLIYKIVSYYFMGK